MRFLCSQIHKKELCENVTDRNRSGQIRYFGSKETKIRETIQEGGNLKKKRQRIGREKEIQRKRDKQSINIYIRKREKER